MPIEDPRLLLIDLENSIGAVRPRPRVLRARLGALLTAAGAVHHTVAGYAVADFADDPTASVLAELGVAPLRVSPAPDAAELVLLAHARRVRDTLGCRSFLVASADRRFRRARHPGPAGSAGLARPADRRHTSRRCPPGAPHPAAHPDRQ